MSSMTQANPFASTETKPQPYAELVTITPDLAREMLDNNYEKQRNKQPVYIRKYAGMMANGHWMVNGETICVSDKGNTLNGQHRLQACIDSDTPFTTFVAYNIDEEAYKTIDNGKSRTMANLLGESTIVANAAMMIWKSEQTSNHADGRVPNPDPVQLSAWLENHTDIKDVLDLVPTKLRSVIHMMHYGAFFYKIYNIDPSKAMEFTEALATGENLSSDSPIYILRERLLRGYKGTHRIRAQAVRSFLHKAWNAHITGRRIVQLKVDTVRGETLPELAHPAESEVQ